MEAVLHKYDKINYKTRTVSSFVGSQDARLGWPRTYLVLLVLDGKDFLKQGILL